MAATSNPRQRTTTLAAPAVGPVAVYGASASVIVPSAEGVTTYRGAEGDPTEQTLRWLNHAFDGIRERHSDVNEPLGKLKSSI